VPGGVFDDIDAFLEGEAFDHGRHSF